MQFPSKELARWMEAPTVGDMEALKRAAKCVIRHGRLIQEFVRDIEGTASCCGVHWLRSRMLPENTQNHLIFQTVFWFPHATFHQHRPSGQLCEFWRIFYTLVKGTSAGLGAISVFKDLEVHICMNTQIDQSVHEVRIDASAGRGWQHDGELGEFGTVPLQRWVCNSSHKMAKSK